MFRLLIILTQLLVFCLSLSAQENRRNSQVQEGILERKVVDKDKYPRTQRDLKATFQNLQKVKQELLAGKLNKVQTTAENGTATGKINEQYFTYLTSSYLYCAIKNGVCKYILDSIF